MQGPRREPDQRPTSASRSAACCRWRSWRCAHLVLAPANITVGHSRPGRPARSPSSSARSVWPSCSSASSRRRSAPRWRRRCRPGYIVAQYLGWPWGKHDRAAPGARASTSSSWSTIDRRRASFGVSGVDPVKVTEYSIVLSAAALPLTYFPILVVANDPSYMGDAHQRPGPQRASPRVYLVILVVVAVATIPLMIITKAGQ